MREVISKVRDWLTNFAKAREGNVAMMAGIALPVLLLVSAGAVDMHNFLRVKSELQDALDAASLAAARSPYTDAVNIQKVGMASMEVNMPQYYNGNPGDVASFTLGGKDKVVGTATVQVKTLIANTFLPPYGKLFDDYLPVTVSSEVMRASRNVEVAMALDITGSMAGTPLADLKAAAKELITIVVQPLAMQTVYTSKVALVPYSAGVNMGTYANTVRGSLTAAKNITSVNVGQGSDVSASTSRSGSTVTITRNNHGLQDGDLILIRYIYSYRCGRDTCSEYRYDVKEVTRRSSSEIRVSNSSDYGSITYRKCTYKNCAFEVTASNHGVVNNLAYINHGTNTSDVLRGGFYAERVDNNKLLIWKDSPSFTDSVTIGGASIISGEDGHIGRAFINVLGNVAGLPSTQCVSERPRPNNAVPTEVAPTASSYLGRVYLESTNTCPEAVFTPLNNNITTLNGLVDSYKAAGSTAGQVGVELAWYALSPTFTTIFPVANRANAYNSAETVKAAILMTDGEFNTPYCQGVIASNATNGSGSDAAHINCAATNGDPFTQSVRMCDAMKAKGIVVYTVAFNLSSGEGGAGIDTAKEVMEACASTPDNFFDPSTGGDLKNAFRAIGRDITRLRIAR